MTVVDQKEAEAGQVLRFTMEEVAVGIGRTSLVPVLDETDEPAERDTPSRRDIGGQSGSHRQVLRDAIAGPDQGGRAMVLRQTRRKHLRASHRYVAHQVL